MHSRLGTVIALTVASLHGRDKDGDSILSVLTRLPVCIIVKLKGCRSTDVEQARSLKNGENP